MSKQSGKGKSRRSPQESLRPASSSHPSSVSVSEGSYAPRPPRSGVDSRSGRPIQYNNNGAPFFITDVDIPSANDVLNGRGGGTNNHPGNVEYRKYIAAQKEEYASCAKNQKLRFSDRVVQKVRDCDPPGRFLEKNEVTGLWDDIGDAKAREKTSQCLREGQPAIKQHGPPSFNPRLIGRDSSAYSSSAYSSATSAASSGEDDRGGARRYPQRGGGRGGGAAASVGSYGGATGGGGDDDDDEDVDAVAEGFAGYFDASLQPPTAMFRTGSDSIPGFPGWSSSIDPAFTAAGTGPSVQYPGPSHLPPSTRAALGGGMPIPPSQYDVGLLLPASGGGEGHKPLVHQQSGGALNAQPPANKQRRTRGDFEAETAAAAAAAAQGPPAPGGGGGMQWVRLPSEPYSPDVVQNLVRDNFYPPAPAAQDARFGSGATSRHPQHLMPPPFPPLSYHSGAPQHGYPRPPSFPYPMPSSNGVDNLPQSGGATTSITRFSTFGGLIAPGELARAESIQAMFDGDKDIRFLGAGGAGLLERGTSNDESRALFCEAVSDGPARRGGGGAAAAAAAAGGGEDSDDDSVDDPEEIERSRASGMFGSRNASDASMRDSSVGSSSGGLNADGGGDTSRMSGVQFGR